MPRLKILRTGPEDYPWEVYMVGANRATMTRVKTFEDAVWVVTMALKNGWLLGYGVPLSTIPYFADRYRKRLKRCIS